MKRILEIGVYKPGSHRLEVVDLTDLQVTVNRNTAVFVGTTRVTNRVRGQAYSASYRISRAYLKQHAQWRMVASQSAQVARPEVVLTDFRRDAA